MDVTPLRVVFAGLASGALLAVALVVSGVAVLAGAGWALVTAGVLLGSGMGVLGWVLLRDPNAQARGAGKGE